MKKLILIGAGALIGVCAFLALKKHTKKRKFRDVVKYILIGR